MKKITVAIIALILVGAGGTVAALYTNIWNPEWNPFVSRPNPDVVIARMAAKMNKLNTVHSEAFISFGFQGEEGDKIMNSEIVFSSDVDKTDSDNPKSKSDFEMNLYSEEVSISGKGQAIGLGETSYFKINSLSLEGLEGEELLSIIVSFIENQWVRIDQEDLEDYGYQISEEEQENIINKIQKIIEGKDLYKVVEELPDEKIDGKNTYHYLLELDQKAIKELVPEVLEVLLEASPETTLPVKEVSEDIDEFFEMVGPISFEVWIGQKDNYLYRAKFDKEIDMKEIGEEEGIISLQVEMNFSNFNDPVVIVAPQEFVTLEEIMGQIMMQMMGGMNFYGPPIQFDENDYGVEEMYDIPVEIKEFEVEDGDPIEGLPIEEIEGWDFEIEDIAPIY